jgi:tetratricopeptide (TPR) repeat protein
MRRTLLAVVPLFLLAGCIQTLAVRTMGGILDYGFEAFNEEGDLQLAKEALGSNLKLLEALIKADPENSKLLLLASQGYSAYALAFVEDDSAERAGALYRRARDFGMRILERKNPELSVVATRLESLRDALHTLAGEDVPAVFWTAFGWGSYINLARTEPSALADLPTVNAMMDFVLEKDPNYYYGGAHLFIGSVLGSTPVMLGGKPDVSRQHFEEALRLNGGKFLMSYVYFAKTYAVQVQDQALFESLLAKVDETSADILPEARLSNAVAKKKALLLRERMPELF